MPLPSPLSLPPTADMHVHLRQSDAMLSAVVPTIRSGGADVVYVMPNLTPPVTTVAAALAYRKRLQAIDPSVTYLMTLYLHPSITAATIREAAATGGIVRGVKAYPAGVTTNSAAGVLDWEQFWPVFAAMEEAGLVLNLHGEVPGDGGGGGGGGGGARGEGGGKAGGTAGSEVGGPAGGPAVVTVFTAEQLFLPTLLRIHRAFPQLRIVLEHCTSAAALECVATQCGPAVACTITAHHLWLTREDWGHGDREEQPDEGGEPDYPHRTAAAGKAHNWCKPAAKHLSDRRALVQAVVRGGPRVMFGSDSAPHPRESKEGRDPAAGCFTQGWATQLVVGALEEGVRMGWVRDEEVAVDKLDAFLGRNARAFYGLQRADRGERIVLERKGERVSERISGRAEGEGDEVEVVPFRAGEEVWSLRWEAR